MYPWQLSLCVMDQKTFPATKSC